MTARSGLLFDLDGTMLDTDPLHFAAFTKLLAEYGKTITEEYYNTRIMGAPIGQIMAELFPEMSADEQWHLGERKESLFREQLNGPLIAKPGLNELIAWARDSNIGICVVTNAPRQNAEMMLGGLNLSDQIDHLLIGLELPFSKPDPYPYLEGIRQLGVGIKQAVAFEDSGPGVQSASSAGLFTFGMIGALGESVLRSHGAADVLNDFTDKQLMTKLRQLSPSAGESVL